MGAICGSARSMDRAAQSMDRKFAQESMDRAGQLLARYRIFAPTLHSSHFYEFILLDRLHYMIGELFPKYQFWYETHVPNKRPFRFPGKKRYEDVRY